MYICKKTRMLFDEPEIIYEKHGLECPPYEEWAVCPCCHDTNYIKAFTCDECGEYIDGKYYETADGNYYCSECCEVHDIFD